jgi:hypothetical protein
MYYLTKWAPVIDPLDLARNANVCLENLKKITFRWKKEKAIINQEVPVFREIQELEYSGERKASMSPVKGVYHTFIMTQRRYDKTVCQYCVSWLTDHCRILRKQEGSSDEGSIWMQKKMHFNLVSSNALFLWYVYLIKTHICFFYISLEPKYLTLDRLCLPRPIDTEVGKQLENGTLVTK